MARQGFDPEMRTTRGGAEVVLHHCPFVSAALEDHTTVCALHLGIAEGLADATPGSIDELIAYDPRKADCRLRIRVAPDAPGAVRTPRRAEDRRQAVLALLARHGYERERGRRKEIALANCPFHRLAEEHRELVCGMNLDFLSGLLAGIGPTERLTARLEPSPGYCCVRIAAE